MTDLGTIQRTPIQAVGRCRVDYSDPVTGRILERIEGGNHVFTPQFYATDFQTTALEAALLLTDGTQTLDTDLPWLPGRPIGYASPSSLATGLFQGAYRSADSYRNRVSQNGVDNLYVYDFLPAQIPDTIRYVGLTAANRGTSIRAPFQYRWPTDDSSGIYDIQRKVRLYGGTVSLSNTEGGAGSVYINKVVNQPGETPVRLDLFDLLGQPDNYWVIDEGFTLSTRGYSSTWGYDYEAQHIVCKLTRWMLEYRRETVSYGEYQYYYTYKFKDDIWIVSGDGDEVIHHYAHTWYALNDVLSTDPAYKGTDWRYYYQFRTGDRFTPYVRLYGNTMYGFSRTPADYSESVSDSVYYVYQYNLSTRAITCTRSPLPAEHPLVGYDSTMYCFKGYTWPGAAYYSSERNGYTANGFTANAMGAVPMYDVYSDSVYSYCPVIIETFDPTSSTGVYGHTLIEKGQTNVYGALWNAKPRLSSFSPDTTVSSPLMPFALTAYRLPADAPVRPEGAAVTIAYGLNITW